MLHTFQELEKDAPAVGLLKKMKTVKFLGSIYILKEVVPCLTTLSKTFQAGALNFSHVGLAINHTQASLEAVKSSQSPLKKLQDYIKPEGRLGSLEMTITDNDKKILGNLLSVYVSGLAKNITSHFNDCLFILSSFSILSPVTLPKSTLPEFKEYGNKEIKILADHFFQEKETEDKEVTKAQLKAEWAKFKFDLDAWKSLIPPSTARGTELVTTCVNQRPSCFNARSKRSSQDSSCKLAATEKPQTTEASYFHQKRHHLSSYRETCFG